MAWNGVKGIINAFAKETSQNLNNLGKMANYVWSGNYNTGNSKSSGVSAATGSPLGSLTSGQAAAVGSVSASLNSKDKNLQSYSTDYGNLLNNSTSSLQSAYNNAVSQTSALDLTDIINSYNQSLNDTIQGYQNTLQSNLNTLNTNAEQSRNDLLTSLKRFQESNAQNMKTQQQDYNSSRADLEDETFMNQRNSMANAAARGIGGSGLQQLAQLQNRIAAGKQVSALANKNQTAQDNLRLALAQEQEDYNTNLAKVNKNLENAILSAQNETADKINVARTNNTNTINQLKYNEMVRQEEAKQRAAELAASLNSTRASQTSQYNNGIAALTNLQNSTENQLKNATTTAEKKEILNTAILSLNTAGGDYNPATYGLYDSSYNTTAVNNLKKLYDYYS